MLGLWLRSLFFNVGWYAGSAVIAILGAPILLLPRRAVVAEDIRNLQCWSGHDRWLLRRRLDCLVGLPAFPGLLAGL